MNEFEEAGGVLFSFVSRIVHKLKPSTNYYYLMNKGGKSGNVRILTLDVPCS